MALRVLFLNPEANLGGAERCLEDLAIEFVSNKRHEITPCVLTLSAGILVDRLRKAGVETEFFPLPPFWAALGENGHRGLWQHPLFFITQVVVLFRWTQRLREKVSTMAPDVIHSNGIKTHLLWGLCSLRSTLSNGNGEIPTIWHIHDFLTSRRFSRALLRWFSRKAFVSVANSSATLEKAHSVLRCSLLRIYNGVSVATTVSKKKAVEHATCRIGLVATYARWKGHDLFFEAIAQLKRQKKTKGLKFFVVGGPIYRSAGSQWTEEELKKQLQHLDIESLVTLVPFTASLDKVYDALDVVVNASVEPEPFGRTIAEAMIRGKSVILPAHGGVTEIARHEIEGLHFIPADAYALADAIDCLGNNAPLRRKMGALAKERAERCFSTTELAKNWTEIYRQAVGLDARPSVLVATGFCEDGWHSMRNVASQLFNAFENEPGLEWTPYLFGPSLGRKPRLWDRRLRYPAWMPKRKVLCLLDHSYADCIVSLRSSFEKIVVVVNDFYFLHTQTPLNAVVRSRILKGIQLADVRVAISEAVRTEGKKWGVTFEDTILYGAQPPCPPQVSVERQHGCLVHVGGTTPRKGIEKLLTLLTLLPENYFLVQVGSHFTAQQRAWIKRHKLQSRVRETGGQSNEEVWNWYRRAHAVLIPSFYEGFSLPAIEARRTGAPVFLNANTPAYEVLRTDAGTTAVSFQDLSFANDARAHNARNSLISGILSTPLADVPFTLAPYFDWQRVGSDYSDLVNSILGGDRRHRLAL